MSGNWMNEWEAERIEYDFDLPDHLKKESIAKEGEKPIQNPPLPGMEGVVSSELTSSPKASTHTVQPVESDRQMNFEAILFRQKQNGR